MGGRKFTPEEDRIVRKFAGKKSAEEIGLILGRPAGGVRSSLRRQGLKNHLYGDAHWATKVDSLRMSMIHTLLDAGFAPSEVHRMFKEPLDLSYNYLCQIACQKYRVRA
jgi:hypothetical protein